MNDILMNYRDMRRVTFGLKIVASDHLTEPYEDWSRVRSPSRARRRMKRGCRQNIERGRRPARSALQMGDTLYMHPATIQLLQQVLKRRQDKRDLMALQMGEREYALDTRGSGP